jgi:hypothetical protein
MGMCTPVWSTRNTQIRSLLHWYIYVYIFDFSSPNTSTATNFHLNMVLGDEICELNIYIMCPLYPLRENSCTLEHEHSNCVLLIYQQSEVCWDMLWVAVWKEEEITHIKTYTLFLCWYLHYCSVLLKARPHYSCSCYSLYTLRVNIRILTRRNLARNWRSVDEDLRAQVKARRASRRAQAWRARARVMWTHLNTGCKARGVSTFLLPTPGGRYMCVALNPVSDVTQWLFLNRTPPL